MSVWKSHGISGCSCELRAISSAALSSASIRPWKKCRCSSGSIGTWFSAPFTYSSRPRYGSPCSVTSTKSSRAGSSSGGRMRSSRGSSRRRIGSAPMSASKLPCPSVCRSWRSTICVSRRREGSSATGSRLSRWMRIARTRAGFASVYATVEVLVRALRLRHPVEQPLELGRRRAGVLGGVSQLVEAALDLRQRAGVVVHVVPERVLALEARLERHPAVREMHELAQHVEIVRKAAGVVVNVVAQRSLHPHPPLQVVVPCAAPSRSAIGRLRRRR